VADRNALLAALFDAHIVVVGRAQDEPTPVIFAEEETQIIGASLARQQEFRNGRACAHLALQKLGRRTAPVLRGKNREPLWPTGTVGSISHNCAFAAAAVGSSDVCAAIGLDVENDAALGPSFAHRVCSPRELERCAELGPSEELATVVFSAKESAYKAQFPLSKAVLFWRDLEVLLESERFTVGFRTVCPPFRPDQLMVGRWFRGAGLVFTGIALARGEVST
jgi:4'-phosphopantetheinyl transferase EntD